MRRSARISRASAGVEVLEGRLMMSATAFPVVKTIDTVNGTELKVVVDGGEIAKILPADGGLAVKSNGQTETFTGTFVNILGKALTGNNKIVVNSAVTIPVVLKGGSGKDTLVAGGGSDQLDAGSGKDF